MTSSSSKTLLVHYCTGDDEDHFLHSTLLIGLYYRPNSAVLFLCAILVLPVFEEFSVMPWVVKFSFLWSQVTIMHGQRGKEKNLI